ncbi:MAG: hypothetical protein R6U37_01420 [Dehalococcoidia bacterium]
MSFRSYQDLEVWQKARVLIAGRLNYINTKQSEETLDKTGHVGRMLNGLRRSLGESS